MAPWFPSSTSASLNNHTKLKAPLSHGATITLTLFHGPAHFQTKNTELRLRPEPVPTRSRAAVHTVSFLKRCDRTKAPLFLQGHLVPPGRTAASLSCWAGWQTPARRPWWWRARWSARHERRLLSARILGDWLLTVLQNCCYETNWPTGTIDIKYLINIKYQFLILTWKFKLISKFLIKVKPILKYN